MSDPRKFILKKYPNKTYCLTSSSWLLPVELNENGEEIIKIHYDKIIFPSENYQEYGIEDARITLVEDIYYMTVCSVSSTRHSTVLYSSENGIDYKLKGIIQDHQNKDMTLFPRKINSKYYALTRPTGDHYFASNTKTKYLTGPSIYMSESPDLLHWKPVEDFVIQPTKSSMFDFKVGAGAPPLETDEGWLVIFHGVEKKDNIGIYRSFICLLEKNDPSIITKILYDRPILESNPDLTHTYDSLKYLENVVFTSGIAENNDMYILASGELDLCCRLTHFNKNEIQKLFK